MEANGGGATPPAEKPDANGKSDASETSTARALPTPQELLATFERLRAEHQSESERISMLQAQLKGEQGGIHA
jgi:hypothetical protein